MNQTFNFTPEEKRVKLAELLQEPAQQYKKYSGPLSQASGSSGANIGEMMKLMMKNKKFEQLPAPTVDKSVPYDPNSQNFTPSGW